MSRIESLFGMFDFDFMRELLEDSKFKKVKEVKFRDSYYFDHSQLIEMDKYKMLWPICKLGVVLRIASCCMNLANPKTCCNVHEQSSPPLF